MEIAERYDLLVIEDNPYGLLGFDREPMRALRARDDRRVIYLGSFSKTFSPGLRVGWVLAPLAVREKLVLATEAQVLCPPSLTQYAVARYLDTQPWREQIKHFVELYRERRDATLESLDALMPPGTTWTRSEEHTSELQSRQYLVCRLLLEKKIHHTLILATPSPPL